MPVTDAEQVEGMALDQGRVVTSWKAGRLTPSARGRTKYPVSRPMLI
jgi:hypothetical protein